MKTLLPLLLFLLVGQHYFVSELVADSPQTVVEDSASQRTELEADIYWDDGTHIDIDNVGFSLQINALLQSSYEYLNSSSRVSENDTSSFDMERARLILSGTALQEEFGYRLEVEFAGDRSGEVLDGYINWYPCDGTQLRMGQMRTATSRQFNSQPHNLQFAQRSLTSDHFDNDRQIGARILQSLIDDRLILIGGIYNGQSSGEGQLRPGLDTNHAYDLSARFDLLGNMNPFEEGDMERRQEHALHFGTSYMLEENNDDTLAATVDARTVATDLNYKYRGGSIHAEYFWEEQEPNLSSLETSDASGFYVQGGYFFYRNRFEFAARYSSLDCDAGLVVGGNCSQHDIPTDTLSAIDLSLNYYWWKNNLKAQIGYGRVNQKPANGTSDLNSHRWLIQISGYF